jgi:ATP-dependent Clp protease ATP-binding subunit ClpA
LNFEFLSADGRRALVGAQRLVRTREQEEVELEHLLRALLDLPEVEGVLEGAGADLATVRLRLEQALRGLPKVPNGKVYLGDRVLRLLDIAQIEARERGAGVVSPLHLLVGIPLETRSPAAEVLRDAGMTLPKLEQAVAGERVVGRVVGIDATVAPRVTGKPPATTSTAAAAAAAGPPATAAPIVGAPGSLLAKYARDLTAQGQEQPDPHR